jgi:hypothetical protein
MESTRHRHVLAALVSTGLACGIARGGTTYMDNAVVSNKFQQTNASATNHFMGPVGIGTNAPDSMLHIEGGLKVTGAMQVPKQGDVSMGSYTNGAAFNGASAEEALLDLPILTSNLTYNIGTNASVSDIDSWANDNAAYVPAAYTVTFDWDDGTHVYTSTMDLGKWAKAFSGPGRVRFIGNVTNESLCILDCNQSMIDSVTCTNGAYVDEFDGFTMEGNLNWPIRLNNKSVLLCGEHLTLRSFAGGINVLGGSYMQANSIVVTNPIASLPTVYVEESVFIASNANLDGKGSGYGVHAENGSYVVLNNSQVSEHGNNLFVDKGSKVIANGITANSASTYGILANNGSYIYAQSATIHSNLYGCCAFRGSMIDVSSGNMIGNGYGVMASLGGVIDATGATSTNSTTMDWTANSGSFIEAGSGGTFDPARGTNANDNSYIR